MGDKLPESTLKQELGPAKYKKKVEAANKFYDEHKAGKRDPKTGVYYNHIYTSDPTKSRIGSGASLGCFPCPKCDSGLSIRRTTAIIICNDCKSMVHVSHCKISDEVTLEIK